MSTDEKVIYFLYNRHGRARVVSRNDWEQSWLNWWYKVHNIQELE